MTETIDWRNPTIVAALIGAVATVIAALIAVLRLSLIRLFSPLGRDLQTALNGAWSGTAIEHSGAGFNQPRTYEVTWNFKAKRFTLNASSTLRFKNEAGV